MAYNLPDGESSSSSSLPLRPRHHSAICFTSCFRSSATRDGGGPDSLVGGTPVSEAQSASTWIRSKTQELPDLREKCRDLVSRAGRRRHRSADFRYDPLSYALNFDEGTEGETLAAEDYRYLRFSSRLPASPPPRPLRVADDRERALQGIGPGRDAPL